MRFLGRGSSILFVLSFLMLPDIYHERIYAQGYTAVQEEVVTRGRMWMGGLPNGMLWRNRAGNDLTYPGFVPAGGGGTAHHRNSFTEDHRSGVFYTGVVGGEEVGWGTSRSLAPDDLYIKDGDPNNTLVKNYDFEPHGTAEPEEWMEAKLQSFKTFDANASSERHMAFEHDAKAMVWSLPRYDDFVIIQNTLTNTDDAAFVDFYVGRWTQYRGAWGGDTRIHDTGVGDPGPFDNEYLWDAVVSPELGFIFYDERNWPPGEEPIEYDIPPGDVTGDAGDPGNILEENSIDVRLYAPQIFANTFLDMTLNKNGNKKIWRHILSRGGDAPVSEQGPSGFIGNFIHSEFVDLIINRQQPEKSWELAKTDVEDYGGSHYERRPDYVVCIGPYDIAPGDSIQWTEIIIAGEIDRQVSMRGGSEATTKYLSAGVDSLKQNWENAKELFDNGLQVTDDVPPPTPADAPQLYNESELVAEPFGEEVEGVQESGFYLLFDAVHEGYTDPITGLDDFAGYKIYESDTDIEGPWVLKTTVTKDELDDITSAGKVRYRHETQPGVPLRFGVTSFDADGNESGLTAYTYFPASAPLAPSDDLSRILVAPNPYRQTSGFLDPGEQKRLAFINVPAQCELRIYTLAGDLVKHKIHDGYGETTWGTSQGDNYMLTDFGQNVQPGVYIYYVKSLVPGHEGEEHVGKFIIIR